MTVLELQSWRRPNWIPNAGEPFLLFAAFGSLDLSSPIDRLKYRAAAVPKGCELHLYDRRWQPASFENLAKQHAWGLAAAENEELAAAAAAAPQFALLRGHARIHQSLDYLRDAVGIVQYLIDRGAQAVFDPQTLQFWSPEDWTTRLFAPAAPVPHEHVIILETPDDDADTAWVHTRGMRKFGRPDLSVQHVGPESREKILDLFNRYVESFASGMTISHGERVMLMGLPPDGIFHLDQRLDHPEFHNAHAEIIWPTPLP